MKLSYGLTIEQTQKLTMTPELIQAIRILQFNTQELDNFVQGELLENPVLEFDRTADIEPPKEQPDFDLREKVKEDYDDISYKQWQYSKDKDTFSFEQFVSKDETLEDSLLLQLTFSKGPQDRKISGGSHRRQRLSYRRYRESREMLQDY